MRSVCPFALILVLTLGASAQQPSVAPNTYGPHPQKPAMSETPSGNSNGAPTSDATPSTPSSSANGSTGSDVPVTIKSSDVSQSKSSKDDTDPVTGVPPLPQGKTSLIGGRLTKIDGVRNRLGVKVFEGGQWTMGFDERTHFYRDGVETTFENVKKGDRVYVDTMLDGNQILARNVRVVTRTSSADARGQVVSFDGDSISMVDELSSSPVRFQVTNETQVKRDGRSTSLSDVQPGSLIAVRFAPESPNHGVAKEVTVIASAGENVTFSGKVTHLDLSTGDLSIDNSSDHKTYDIGLDHQGEIPANLMVGSEVRVTAVFDGKQYRAHRISVDKASP